MGGKSSIRNRLLFSESHLDSRVNGSPALCEDRSTGCIFPVWKPNRMVQQILGMRDEGKAGFTVTGRYFARSYRRFALIR